MPEPPDAPLYPHMKLIEACADILGGTPVIAGTRVPVALLFDNLADGLNLDEILDSYPSLPRDSAIAVLELARDLLIQSTDVGV